MSDTPVKYAGKGQTLQANTTRVSELLGAVADDMERTRTGEKVPLSDLERVKSVAAAYMRECAVTGKLPSVRGCAARLGVSRQSLYDYRKAHENSAFSKWLEDFSDLCGEVMMQAAVEGAVQAVPAIFIAKSRYQWREAPQQIELGRINPLAEDGRDTDEIAVEIASKYRELPSD